MAENDRCPKCGALVLPEENYCPRCGEPLVNNRIQQSDNGSVPENITVMPVHEPRTLEELKAFCARNEMPLGRMRFFLDEDYKEPRAFGIYRDGDQFVVYKNKANGSRAERYHGPDEAWAVKELYDKLLEECHARDIWPDGKPEEVIRQEKKARMIKQVRNVIFVVAIVACVLFAIWCVLDDMKLHSDDGYYMYDSGLYYRYGDNWYYDDSYANWILVDSILDNLEYRNYYAGDDYDDSWGYSDFKDSSTWEDIRAEEESHTSSSDYSSWDSSDTDWDSDW